MCMTNFNDFLCRTTKRIWKMPATIPWNSLATDCNSEVHFSKSCQTRAANQTAILFPVAQMEILAVPHAYKIDLTKVIRPQHIVEAAAIEPRAVTIESLRDVILFLILAPGAIDYAALAVLHWNVARIRAGQVGFTTINYYKNKMKAFITWMFIFFTKLNLPKCRLVF